MKIFNILRSNDWWEPKLVPLLSIYYLTLINFNEDIIAHFGTIMVLILSIAVGAIYVSILNDYTDLKLDLACNKPNRLQNFSPLKRNLILSASIIISVLCSFLFFNDLLSLILYLAAYLSFSLYSISPFRFKNRGLLGVISDACGAHLFPSLLVVSYISKKLDLEIETYWFVLIGIWSLAFGLRGILWHQFWDRKNDIAANIKTFATTISPPKMKPFEKTITLVEISALLLILLQIEKALPFIILLFYFLTLIGFKKLKIKTIMFLSDDRPFHIFMTEYYMVLLPYSLIMVCSIQNPICLILIIFHLFFFPVNTKSFVKHILIMMNLKRA